MNLDQHIQDLGAEGGRLAFMELHNEAVLSAIAQYDAHNTCMTRQECAEYLNVSYQTVGNHIASGKIKVNSVGSIPKIQFLSNIINKKEAVGAAS